MNLFELMLSDAEVSRHVQRLISWYDYAGTGAEYNQSLLAALVFAHRVVPYEPYDGPLFRAQVIDASHEIGKTYTLKSERQPIVSFTTSAGRAERFKDEFIHRNDPKSHAKTGIVRLVSSEKELANLAWMKKVAKKLLKDYPKNKTVFELNKVLQQDFIKDEDEVIVQLSRTYTVEILDSPY